MNHDEPAEADVRFALSTVDTDTAPPMRMDAAAIAGRGGRIRKRRKALAVIGSSVATIAAVLAVVLVADPGMTEPGTVQPAGPGLPIAPPTPVSPATSETTAVQESPAPPPAPVEPPPTRPTTATGTPTERTQPSGRRQTPPEASTTRSPGVAPATSGAPDADRGLPPQQSSVDTP